MNEWMGSGLRWIGRPDLSGVWISWVDGGLDVSILLGKGRGGRVFVILFRVSEFNS